MPSVTPVEATATVATDPDVPTTAVALLGSHLLAPCSSALGRDRDVGLPAVRHLRAARDVGLRSALARLACRLAGECALGSLLSSWAGWAGTVRISPGSRYAAA